MNSTRTSAQPTISASEIARIAKRHDDIPQDALPVAEVPARDASDDEGAKTKAPKSVRWKQCPHHTPSGKKQLTGLVLDGSSLVFREHRKSIGKFLVRCPGSGKEWIEADA